MSFSANKYSVRLKDFLKGLLMAVGTSVGVVIQASADAGELVFNWKAIAMAAIASALTYIVRKYLVDDVKLAKKTIQDAKNEK